MHVSSVPAQLMVDGDVEFALTDRSPWSPHRSHSAAGTGPVAPWPEPQ